MRALSARAAAALAIACCAAAGVAPAQAPEPRLARIAFNVDGHLYTIAADGSGRTHVTGDSSHSVGRAAWSPDGGTLAFTRGSEDERPRVMTARPDGSADRAITSPGSKSDDRGPAWSPDGQRVAFDRTTFGRDRVAQSLRTVARDGADMRVVYSETSDYYDEDNPEVALGSPAWSPDGTQMLFSRGKPYDDGFGSSLYVVPADGSGPPRELVRDAEQGAWSPDGARIAFSAPPGRERGPCGTRCRHETEIYVANADGGGIAPVTHNPADDESPSWSGDGQRIAFDSARNQPDELNREIYSVRPDGSCLTWLTNGSRDSETPAFEPGAPLASDPGACGEAGRVPLVETDVSAAAAFREFPVYWAGPVSPDMLLLTDVELFPHEPWFGYGDCGRFDPRDCPDTLGVLNTRACSRPQQLRSAGSHPERLTIHRGALLWTRLNDDSASLFTGRTVVHVNLGSRGPGSARLAGGLRRFPTDAPAAKLPRTLLPVVLWRRIARADSGRSRGKEAASYRRLGRRLRKLGVSGRIAC